MHGMQFSFPAFEHTTYEILAPNFKYRFEFNTYYIDLFSRLTQR